MLIFNFGTFEWRRCLLLSDYFLNWYKKNLISKFIKTTKKLTLTVKFYNISAYYLCVLLLF